MVSNHNPPDLYLQNIKDYRYEPLALLLFEQQNILNTLSFSLPLSSPRQTHPHTGSRLEGAMA
jgi:hypothetical protein